MADRKPRDFTSILASQLRTDTQLYTQVPGSPTPEGDYKFTLADVITFLRTQGFIRVIAGTHISDAAAITAGGVVGDYYRLSPTNIYGTPVGDGGILKRIN